MGEGRSEGEAHAPVASPTVRELGNGTHMSRTSDGSIFRVHIDIVLLLVSSNTTNTHQDKIRK